jgi:hypothetical protein
VETYRITSDIERIETSVTVAGRRVGVRAALLLLIGLLLSSGLVGLLAPALGSPTLFVPLGLVPLYFAALIAFVRPGDGRPVEMQLLDRVRFARATKRSANLGLARMESGSSVLDLTKEVFSVKDVRMGHEVKADLTELDMPFTVRGRSDLRLLIGDLRITVRREEGSDEIAVTVRQA